ncbi:MAG TPA: 50S ribosomal protein L11 methyltransferase [Gaiellaceae bacterium]|nr:50S ribosomal protein L11 methyltransferase [Gaiellaceae bacterium]
MAVRVPASEAEKVAAQLLDLFPAGIQERALGGSAELAVYTDEAGEAVLRDVFPDASIELVEGGWEDRWKDFHRPTWVGGLWIGPPWITPPTDDAVVVDPGRAFGTGAHPTTRACIELLARLERGSLVDAGCGSGVVAVAAARLGFAPVYAVDLDEVAVEVAAGTVRRNEVVVDVCRADVLRDELPSVDIVVANIELLVVEQLLECLAARVAVTAGYLEAETPRARGWTHDERLEVEGWAADTWRRRH